MELTLDERLQSTDVTFDDVLELLHEVDIWNNENGIELGRWVNFFKREDLLSYKDVIAWWPLDAPGNYARPTLRQLCHQYQNPLFGATFADRLTARIVKATEWLISEGRDPAYPNETPAERKARLNGSKRVKGGIQQAEKVQLKEVKAQATALAVVTATQLRLERREARAQEAAVIAQGVQQRRQERKRLAAIKSAQQKEIGRLYNVFLDTCRQRREAAIEWDNKVADAQLAFDAYKRTCDDT